jgi:hypothetical protein
VKAQPRGQLPGVESSFGQCRASPFSQACTQGSEPVPPSEGPGPPASPLLPPPSLEEPPQARAARPAPFSAECRRWSCNR